MSRVDCSWILILGWFVLYYSVLKSKRISEENRISGWCWIRFAIDFAGMYPHVQTIGWPWGKLIRLDLVQEIRLRKIELCLNWGLVVLGTLCLSLFVSVCLLLFAWRWHHIGVYLSVYIPDTTEQGEPHSLLSCSFMQYSTGYEYLCTAPEFKQYCHHVFIQVIPCHLVHPHARWRKLPEVVMGHQGLAHPKWPCASDQTYQGFQRCVDQSNAPYQSEGACWMELLWVHGS